MRVYERLAGVLGLELACLPFTGRQKGMIRMSITGS